MKRGLLKRTVDHVKAVDGLSLKLREGQTLGVVGESGSGKTTLGLALLRLISSEGKIAYVGKRIDAVPLVEGGFLKKARREIEADVEPVRLDRHRVHIGALTPEVEQGAVVGRTLHHHRVTGPDQVVEEERVGLQ